MPKNKGGGRNHKKQANKHMQPSGGGNIRMPKDKDEILAKVLRPLGNGRAEVQCSDGITRILEIRKKFRGRNKRDNDVSVGVIVLVGLREWEVINVKKTPKADLLYVYSSGQHDILMKNEDARFLLIGTRKNDEMCGFEFTNTATWKQKVGDDTGTADGVLDDEAKKVSIEVKESIGMDPMNDTDFNWDDI